MKGIPPARVAVFLAFVLAMGITGTALAWQYDQSYTASTLYGGTSGKPWSPSGGRLQGDVASYSGPYRITNPIGNNVYWGSAALNYIRSNGQNVSITFHSYDINNGCSTFKIESYASTNLPAPQYTRYIRQCWPFEYTEGRIASTNANSMSSGTYYWGQAVYKESTVAITKQKITVDTYNGSQENWHQTYCIEAGQLSASIC